MGTWDDEESEEEDVDRYLKEKTKIKKKATVETLATIEDNYNEIYPPFFKQSQ